MKFSMDNWWVYKGLIHDWRSECEFVHVSNSCDLAQVEYSIVPLIDVLCVLCLNISSKVIPILSNYTENNSTHRPPDMLTSHKTKPARPLHWTVD